MKIIKWIDLNDTKEIEENNYFGIKYETSKYKEADYNEDYEDSIIKELVDNQYIICGDTHQYMYIPVFENNRYIILSMRKWGEIMAEAMNLIENSNKYNYKDFYLVKTCRFKENLPIK